MADRLLQSRIHHLEPRVKCTDLGVAQGAPAGVPQGQDDAGGVIRSDWVCSSTHFLLNL